MRTLLPAVVIWALAGLPVATEAQEAAAGKRLVMPYHCSFDGDRLRVRPSDAKTYEVLGLHNQQAFTTCNPTGERCSTLAIHRFSISCGGLTVPWMRIAAAIGTPKPGRRWVEAGHLNIVRPMDIAARDMPACQDGAPSSNGRECLPWKQRGAMERIILPQGFAPLGEARLELAAAASTGANEKAAVAASAKPPAAAAPAAGAATTVASDAAKKFENPLPRNSNASTAGRPAAVSGKPGSAEWVSVVEAKDLSEVAAGEADYGRRMLWVWLGGLALLALIAAGLALLPHARSGKLRLTLVRAAKMTRVHYKVTRRHLKIAAAGLAPRLAAIRDDLGQRLRSRGTSTASDAAEAAAADLAQPEDAAMASAAWQAATLLDEIERAVQGLAHSTPLRGVLEDELSSINQRLVVTRAASLDGGSPVKAATQYRALVRELERVRRIATSAAASLSGSRQTVGMPSTKGEAYQLLGVNPDVSEGILKKIVDALRMTWHPDHARDERDRLLREDRIKQINIAWDLINDKRAAA